MIKEFEGKTEKEAIDNAVTALNLEKEEFDVEIIEASKKGLFRKGNVKIRVHIDDEDLPSGFEQEPFERKESDRDGMPAMKQTVYKGPKDPQDEFENKLVEYLRDLIGKMGFPGDVTVGYRDDRKLGLTIASGHSGILIGKKGKNLDALQLLVNVYAGKYNGHKRIIVDAENYRFRHEESIVRMASKAAEQVRRSKRSRLLEPMNPFERRLVHTSLNQMEDIDTKSEGDGLYKQVRIIYRGIDR